MYLRMAKRLLLETDKRLLWKATWNAGFKGMRSIQKFKKRMKKGEYFPPILFISIINSCNLRCQGCWVDVGAEQSKIEADAMHKLINESKEAGNSIFGILGGEPFLHKDLLSILEQHPDCYFQVFTNGHYITDEVAARLRNMGNVTPLISVEGSEIVSDERRGRPRVLSKTMQGIENALKHKLFTGVCTSLCQSNIDDLLNEAWVDRLIEMGVMYCWFHNFRPVGPDASPELALTPEQQRRSREFVVNMRAKKPIIIVDAYYDGEGQALCPAVTGISHHIGPWGNIEPCPVIQFAKESIYDEGHIKDIFAKSEFLHDFRTTVAQETRGCVILERPDILQNLMQKHGAKDSTARQQIASELAAIQPRPSQWDPEVAIPEKNPFYRWAKKFFYHDFGVYAEARLEERGCQPPPPVSANSTTPAKKLYSLTPRE
ncbi:Pyrroloquinoline quinone biosynthesis protein PqqE [Planctomycetales bacterium 10988]|nr:Pyrroloquinoline quinone biosynthesis protein PqqE [Planctomycetales bacterium 10988]